jgi:uncharacterized cofD-like protein
LKIIEWLRPGIKVKRWIFLGIFGLMLVIFGVLETIRYRFIYTFLFNAFYIFLIASGMITLYISVISGMKSIIALVNKGYLNVPINSKKLETMIYEKRLLVKGPKIVTIGGGTGLSTMLRGLKYYTSNITAIVTVSDDGGGSGELREDLGMLPPGDIRNCLLALSDTEPLMEQLLQYRFTDGRLKNQSFGNLFLAAMDGISNNFEEAVNKMSSVLAVTGKVIPVTTENIILKAELENGELVTGESLIPVLSAKGESRIKRVFLDPPDAKPLPQAIDAIMEADAVILGPGSLYTSIIPNILIDDIKRSLKNTNALRIYVSNIMTQPGETDGYSVENHIKAINKHAKGKIIDSVVVNDGVLGKELEDRYSLEKSYLVQYDEEKIKNEGINIIKGDFIHTENGHIRHNTEKLASILISNIMEEKLLFDKKKIIEYFYLSERLKGKNKEINKEK